MYTYNNGFSLLVDPLSQLELLRLFPGGFIFSHMALIFGAYANSGYTKLEVPFF